MCLIEVVRKAHVGMRVKVGDDHRRTELRGMVGRVVAIYGRPGYRAVDVRLADGRYQLFRPEELEKVSSPKPWWRFLLTAT